jgi:hypothetical protein
MTWESTDRHSKREHHLQQDAPILRANWVTLALMIVMFDVQLQRHTLGCCSEQKEPIFERNVKKMIRELAPECTHGSIPCAPKILFI